MKSIGATTAAAVVVELSIVDDAIDDKDEDLDDDVDGIVVELFRIL